MGTLNLFAMGGVPISWRLYGGIIVGLIGVALVLMPNDRVFSAALLFALGSSLCLGFSMVAARRLSQTESAQRILIYYFFNSHLSYPTIRYYGMENSYFVSMDNFNYKCNFDVYPATVNLSGMQQRTSESIEYNYL